MAKHVAVYVRVSSKSQDTAAQEAEMKRWAAGQSSEVRFYRDKFTGKSMDRPGWNKLHKAILAGEVSAVAIWRLDRLGRTAKGLTALFDELKVRNVNLVSLKDGLDLTTEAGRLMANILASVAQFETEVRSERQRLGIEAAKAKGVTFGPKPGTRKGVRISVTPEQEQQVRRLHAEGGKDGKVAAIARATGLSRPTVYSILKP